MAVMSVMSVSYTHLDVYKRQVRNRCISFLRKRTCDIVPIDGRQVSAETMAADEVHCSDEPTMEDVYFNTAVGQCSDITVHLHRATGCTGREIK